MIPNRDYGAEYEAACWVDSSTTGDKLDDLYELWQEAVCSKPFVSNLYLIGARVPQSHPYKPGSQVPALNDSSSSHTRAPASVKRVWLADGASCV
jgi:hypothetical protein